MFKAYRVNTLSLEVSRCNGCGMCVTVCPHRVFSVANGAARIERAEGCMECGACALNCPRDAISVDSGVGCATAMIVAALTGKKEVACG